MAPTLIDSLTQEYSTPFDQFRAFVQALSEQSSDFHASLLASSIAQDNLIHLLSNVSYLEAYPHEAEHTGVLAHALAFVYDSCINGCEDKEIHKKIYIRLIKLLANILVNTTLELVKFHLSPVYYRSIQRLPFFIRERPEKSLLDVFLQLPPFTLRDDLEVHLIRSLDAWNMSRKEFIDIAIPEGILRRSLISSIGYEAFLNCIKTPN